MAISDVAMFLYCIDTYNAFKKSQTNQSSVPFLVKHAWGLPLLLTIGIGMVIVDLIVLNMSMRRMLALPNTVLIPTLYLLMVYITTLTSLLILSFKVKHQVKDAKANFTGASLAAITPVVNRVETMRRWMLVSSLGRFINIMD